MVAEVIPVGKGGCCEINDYAEPEDENETACETCGHSPEEHEPWRDEDYGRTWI